ncbi:MAG: altronate dehydratase family protein [Clostridia bacterium]|nr:altronate dehydratase family protein [Clostridia bacterium]
MIQIHPRDTVEVDPYTGHKYALKPISPGEPVIKYGFPIGIATASIAKREWVHTHNLKTALQEGGQYHYQPSHHQLPPGRPKDTFLGYRRENGEVGIRNDIWILPTVGCVNQLALALARETGAFAFPHPYGCSQLGEDLEMTKTILCALAGHPNAGGVLILGLGCENNRIQELGLTPSPRLSCLNAQDCQDEMAQGIATIQGLQRHAARDQRRAIPVSELKIGLKCGGSDGLSGITANPLVGRICDQIVEQGGGCILTEVPEMFGAETILMNRCETEELFFKTVDMIQRFQTYFIRHGQPIWENPSPGNKEGGITTLEEKSLGCIQKGGQAPVTDVLRPGQQATKRGLSLLYGPGNDLVSMTLLAASGAHMILFTTGRGTPAGSCVPTLKISTNSALAEQKPGWIDFNAGGLIEQSSWEAEAGRLYQLILKTANGQEAKHEQKGYREIAIFKDGVTL